MSYNLLVSSISFCFIYATNLLTLLTDDSQNYPLKCPWDFRLSCSFYSLLPSTSVPYHRIILLANFYSSSLIKSLFYYQLSLVLPLYINEFLSLFQKLSVWLTVLQKLVTMFWDTMYTSKDYTLQGASCGQQSCPSTRLHPPKQERHFSYSFECDTCSATFLIHVEGASTPWGSTR